MCIHYPSTIPLEIWFPYSILISGSKGPFWESNFLCVYTLLLPYLLKFDSVKPLSGLEIPFWESNFLCVYTLLLPYLLKLDSRKAAFRLERAVLGINFYMEAVYNCVYIHSASTIPFFIWLRFGSMVPSVLPTSSEPLQQQMFTDTEKNNDVNISCARHCAFLRLPGKTRYKFTTTYSNHTLYKTLLRGFWSSLNIKSIKLNVPYELNYNWLINEDSIGVSE